MPINLLAKARIIKDRLDRGDAIEDIVTHLQKVTDSRLSDRSLPITEVLKATGRYDTVQQLRTVIQESLDDALNDIELPDGSSKPAIKNIRVSQDLYSQVEEYIIEYVRASGVLDRDAKVKNLVTDFVDGIIKNDTSEYGLSSYNWAGNSLAPVVGDLLDEEVDFNTFMVALYPLEDEAKIDGNHTWIEPIVNDMIKDADQFPEGTPTDAVLGNGVRVEPIDNVRPVVYQMIYEDQGVIVELTKDSVPILLEIDKVKAEYRDGRETVVSDGETLTIAPVNEADTDVHVNAGETRKEARDVDPITISEIGKKVTDVIKDAGESIADAVKVDDFVIKDANLDLLQRKLAELKRAKKTRKNQRLMLAIEAEIIRKGSE